MNLCFSVSPCWQKYKTTLMANIKTVLIALFILLNYETGNAQDHNLSREQIKEDISYLINSLENVHINPFNKYNKTDFLKGMQKAEKELSKSTNPNSIEFYKKVQPEIVKLNDGHTYIHMSEYEKYDTYIFPFDLAISKNSIKITNQKSNYFNKDKNLFINKRIKKINDKSAKEIIDMSDKYISGENEITRITAGKYYFEFFFNLFIDNKKGYTTIEFNDGSKEKILLLKKSEWKNTVSQTNENDYYNYDVFKDYAILNFKSFQDLDKFKNFLSNMFKDLGNKKINTLIIDIRDNEGGNSDLGDELLKYLVSVPFTQYEKTLMKYSEISKNTFKKYPNIDKDYLSSYLNKKNGTIDTIDKSKNLTEPFNTEKRYSGKVFLLINSLTYSSAADFAQAFKYYKIGRIIGDETGGQIISPGEPVNTKLPNSKLDFTISSSRDYDIGAKENDWHGVIPDVKINASEALKYIIEKNN